jgi:hypothetical protein
MGFGSPALQYFRYIFTQDNEFSKLGIKKVTFGNGETFELEAAIAKIPDLKRIKVLLCEMFSRKLPGYQALHSLINEAIDELLLHLGVEVLDVLKWTQNFIKCFILCTRKTRGVVGFERPIIRLKFAKLFCENKDNDCATMMRNLQLFCIEEAGLAETEFARVLSSDNTEDLEVKYQSWIRSFERVDSGPATYTNLPPFVR